MDKREKNKKEMLGTVSGFYTTEKDSFTALPGLVAAFADVIAINKEIDLNEQVVQVGTSGKVVSKDGSQDELIITALVFAGAIYGYAAKENDLELLTFADMNSNTFHKLRDAEIPLRVEKILEKADELAAALVPFGISEAKRNEGKASLDDYVAKFGSVNMGKGGKKSAAESTKKLLKKVDQKLKVLDKLMLPFRKKDTNLYSRYESARMIYDKGGRHNGGSDTPPPQEPPK
ncbi:MAG: hypothetical protein WC209_18300 [Ignavibacteriaceae bacterium]|jgi:hypothetical protein